MRQKVRTVRWFIGIVGTILLLFTGTGSKILENRTTKSIITNPNLLQQLGKQPSDFEGTPERLDNELVFHAIGGLILLGYLFTVILKYNKPAFILLCFVIFFFLLVRLETAFTLTQEQQSRGYTLGGWIGRVGSYLLPFAVEMAIISQGWVALRPRCNRVNFENESAIDTPVAIKDD